jgi:lysophospholipase L1-like esterase
MGCGNKPPQLPVLAENAKIIAFGDELTAAPHLTNEQTYPALLEKQLKRPVINAGVAGETLAQAVKRFHQLIETEKPALIILCHGGYHFEPDNEKNNVEILEQFRQMLGFARAKKVSVILMGVPEKTPPHFAPAGFYKRLASAFEIPYNGAILSKLLPNPQMMDTAHSLPNPQAYQLVVDALVSLLQETHAISTQNTP